MASDRASPPSAQAPAPHASSRHRPSRFDRPVPAAIPSGATFMAANKHHGSYEDDPLVPDDILEPEHRPDDITHGRDLGREELTALPQINPNGKISQTAPSLYPNRRARPVERDSDRERASEPGRPSSPLDGQTGSRTSSIHINSQLGADSEWYNPIHPSVMNSASSSAGRKRTPLPPQTARFRESAFKPKGPPPTGPLDQNGRQSYRPQHSPVQSTAALPSGPRDQHQSPDAIVSLNPPSGPRYSSQEQVRGENEFMAVGSSNQADDGDVVKGYERERRLSEGSYSQSRPPVEISMDVDIDRLSSPSSSRMETSTIIRSGHNDAPTRAVSGMYADREGLNGGDVPRGPRAMASKAPMGASNAYVAPSPPLSTSPTALFDMGYSGGRMRERSPPPHLVGNGNLQPNDRWREGDARHDGPSSRVDPPSARQTQGHPMERGGVITLNFNSLHFV